MDDGVEQQTQRIYQNVGRFLLIAQNFPFLLRGVLKRGHWTNVRSWGEPDTLG